MRLSGPCVVGAGVVPDPEKGPPMTNKTNTATLPSTQPEQSKRKQLIQLLERDSGATLDEMTALTGWLPHTTRAAITGLRKKGHVITSDKVNGVRTYRAAAPESAE
jgi:Protein of unknown function (DUF3489)